MHSKDRKRREALSHVTAGDGRQLKPFCWWQPLSRALFYLQLSDADGKRVTYAVDVPYWQRIATENGEGKAHLHVDGVHRAASKLPAVFAVPGGVIEVEATSFGLKPCHYRADDGTVRRLVPDDRSAEGRRARLAQQRPGLSVLISTASVIMIIVPIVLGVPQIVEAVTHGVPPIAERFGTFTSPVQLPVWLNIVLGLCTATASVERATRLRHNPALDG